MCFILVYCLQGKIRQSSPFPFFFFFVRLKKILPYFLKLSQMSKQIYSPIVGVGRDTNNLPLILWLGT